VSFYNQASSGDSSEPVFPTPVIGMMGVLPDKDLQTGIAFRKEGDLVFLIGSSRNDINCSEYLYSYHKVKLSPPPLFRPGGRIPGSPGGEGADPGGLAAVGP
jgi:phosphoribosylformylglycinamidine synthase subunit PurL